MEASPPVIKPRMFAVDFKRLPGDLGTTAIVLADAPEDALEKAFSMFPEYRQASRPGHVFEIEYAEIDWDTGRDFVIQVKKRPPNLLLYKHAARLGPRVRSWREGRLEERHASLAEAFRWRDWRRRVQSLREYHGNHAVPGYSQEVNAWRQLLLFPYP
jgi:hypothetical protein